MAKSYETISFYTSELDKDNAIRESVLRGVIYVSCVYIYICSVYIYMFCVYVCSVYINVYVPYLYVRVAYGVASISRLLQIVGLFCRIQSLL